MEKFQNAQNCFAGLLAGALLVAACGNPDAGFGGESPDASSAPDGGGSNSNEAPTTAEAGTDASAGAPCGGGCGAGALCCANACVATASCAFAVTGLSSAVGWQNGGDWITLTGAGFAAGMKVFVGDGRAPTLVRSATTAIIQTPPGVGTVDVRVVSGKTEAALPKAFTYQGGGLTTAWVEKAMQAPRGRAPGIAVMQDGRVLLAGGVTGPNGYGPDTAVDTADIFDRPSATLTPVASKMSTVRWYSSAVTLLDGRVLVVGGAGWQGGSPSYGDPTRADVFDPATGTFTPTAGPLAGPRTMPRGVLMVDGRVLFLSWDADGGVDVFDPSTGTFSVVNPATSHAGGFVVRLRDGRVLFGGGHTTAEAELFDPDTNKFSPAAPLNTQRYWPSAHTLPDGRVAVLGGSPYVPGLCCGWSPLGSIELFDPASATFTVAPYGLTAPRFEHTSALVRDGTILVLGGFTVPGDCTSLSTLVDQVDPVKGTVTSFTGFPHATAEVSAVTLLDGSVLVAGGGGCASAPVPNVDFLEGGPWSR